MLQTTHLKIGVTVVTALLAWAPTAHAQATKPPATPKPAAAPAPAPAEESRELNLRAYVHLLRSDLRAQKVAIIADVMQFSEGEDAKFWPVYRQYEKELATINDERLAMIKEYAASHATLTDQMADALAKRAIALQLKRDNLVSTYYDRFKAVLPAKTAARFLQVEHQILLILDLQIAAALPIVR